MALSAAQNWFNRASGNAANGGGFDPSLTGGMLTDGAATSATGTAPVFTSASYSFVAGDVGHWIYIASGTNWTPGFYQIASVAGGAATLTGTAGSAYIVTWGRASTTNGCATTASPTGATFSVCYCDSDAAVFTTSDLTSTASTTATSVLTAFTPVMVGNVIRLASGTGTTPGYYAITAYVSASQITLDRASGTYTAGVGSMGGAFALLENFASTASGGLSTPAITTPLAAGHSVNIRGAGSDDPSSNDYDYSGGASHDGFYTIPDGSLASGRIHFQGYNGRPRLLTSGLLFNNVARTSWNNVKFVFHASAPSSRYLLGLFNVAESRYNQLRNVIIDVNGLDAIGASVDQAIDCIVRNTGGGAAGTGCGISHVGFGGRISGCTIKGMRGDGIRNDASLTGGLGSISDNLILNSGRDGIRLSGSAYGDHVIGNTINGSGSDAIEITTAAAINLAVIVNNSLSNSGGYGLNLSVGTAALNDRLVRTARIDHNNYYSNTSGPRNGISASPNDTAVDPQYTNAAGDDFSIGTNMKATAFPGAIRGSSTTSYVDRGAVQRQEPAGDGSRAFVFGG